jgi:prepilin-type N-terminal cleavage/methylation domain-containing protein
MPFGRQAFTLIELLVVIAIIGLLSTIAAVGLDSSRVKTRNAQRKANLVQISKALELYYADNGAYPSTNGVWQGTCSSFVGLPDSGAGAWIPNFQNYMAQLPRDVNTAKVNPSSSVLGCRTTAGVNCFIYNSNLTGTDYKLLAHCIPEGSWTSTDFFYDPVRPGHAWQVSTPGAINW